MADERKPLQGITFLTEEQIWGDGQGNGQLEVMKSYGTKVGMSDLAMVLGAPVSASNTTSDNQRSGYLWSASPSRCGDVGTVDKLGKWSFRVPYRRAAAGARPALPSSVASLINISSDGSAEALAKGEGRFTRKISGVDVVEYGEYPQTIAAENVSRELEQSFSRGQLQKTGKTYTFDGEKRDSYDSPFSAKEHAEYQHKGKRYIRVKAKPYSRDNPVLSNGKKPQAGEACWIEVQPIEWLKDPSGMMVARQALFAGVQFDRNQRYDGNFEKTDMYRYLNTHFARDMMPSQQQAQSAGQGAVQQEHEVVQSKKHEAAQPEGIMARVGSWAKENPATLTTSYGDAVQARDGSWVEDTQKPRGGGAMLG